MLNGKLPTKYQEFIHLSRYSRWLPKEGRRETWRETVTRYFDFFQEHLKQSCKLELNTGETLEKSILDTSGNSNKGLLIGDYKVKKVKKGQSMRRDSFIKVPKKTGNSEGAL